MRLGRRGARVGAGLGVEVRGGWEVGWRNWAARAGVEKGARLRDESIVKLDFGVTFVHVSRRRVFRRGIGA